jgi:hypothetical protein
MYIKLGWSALSYLLICIDKMLAETMTKKVKCMVRRKTEKYDGRLQSSAELFC